MTTTAAILRVLPAPDRRDALAWHIAHNWARMFGRRATAADVSRRWQIDLSTSELVLAELIDRHVLLAPSRGYYELARPL